MNSCLTINRFTIAAARLEQRLLVQHQAQRLELAALHVHQIISTIYQTAQAQDAQRLAAPWVEILFRLSN